LTEGRAFDGVISSPLAGRSAKPRNRGETMLIDKGLGLSQTGDLLELGCDFIDYIKFGFGTAALYSRAALRAKIALITSYGVSVYPGGTFLEIAVAQGRLDEYLERCRELGFTHIEVSDGTIDLSADRRVEAIDKALAAGFSVITEVGKKDGAIELDPTLALEQVIADLTCGATKVIVEGRESGSGVGIYDQTGTLKRDEMEALVGGLSDPSLLMWEAPQKSQQVDLIHRFGPNVNLGNIAPGDVIALEALRLGLRGDTLLLSMQHEMEK